MHNENGDFCIKFFILCFFYSSIFVHFDCIFSMRKKINRKLWRLNKKKTRKFCVIFQSLYSFDWTFSIFCIHQFIAFGSTKYIYINWNFSLFFSELFFIKNKRKVFIFHWQQKKNCNFGGNLLFEFWATEKIWKIWIKSFDLTTIKVKSSSANIQQYDQTLKVFELQFNNKR